METEREKKKEGREGERNAGRHDVLVLEEKGKRGERGHVSPHEHFPFSGMTCVMGKEKRGGKRGEACAFPQARQREEKGEGRHVRGSGSDLSPLTPRQGADGKSGGMYGGKKRKGEKRGLSRASARLMRSTL